MQCNTQIVTRKIYIFNKSCFQATNKLNTDYRIKPSSSPKLANMQCLGQTTASRYPSPTLCPSFEVRDDRNTLPVRVDALDAALGPPTSQHQLGTRASVGSSQQDQFKILKLHAYLYSISTSVATGEFGHGLF